jgi:hypothetical protein
MASAAAGQKQDSRLSEEPGSRKSLIEPAAGNDASPAGVAGVSALRPMSRLESEAAKELNPGFRRQDAFLPENQAGAESPSAPRLQAVHLPETARGAELSIGVNSQTFGPIHLHARLSDERVTAAIDTSHEVLHAALAAETPMLENAMARHELRLETLRLDAGPVNASLGGFDQQRRDNSAPPPPAPRWETRASGEPRSSAPPMSRPLQPQNMYRLDVQA